MASLWLVLLLAVLGTVSTADVEARKPKLFYVSTTSTTTTINSVTVCFISTTGVVGLCGRKRRSIRADSPLGIDAAKIAPGPLGGDLR
jgi:hypothetical protein